jgi:hypothetical protein
VLESAALKVTETGLQSAPPGELRGGPPGPPDEFAGIPSRPSRHPVIAAAAIALAGYLVFQIRADVRYALSPATPIELGDARALPANAPTNRLVRLSGHGDRESALILDTQGAWTFSQFFRLLGTEDRVFVQRAPDPLPLALADRDVFTGRLVPFRELSFQESIRRHFASQVSATNFFEPAALKAALAHPRPLTLADRLGQTVTLGGDAELAVDTLVPGALRIELPADRWPDLARARSLVADQGGVVLSAETTDNHRQAVVARFPQPRHEIALAALSDLDRRVRILPARTTTRVRIADLSASDAGLVTPKAVLPYADVQSVRSVAPVRIPDGAWLLIEGDHPRDHIRSVLVAVLLVGFALVNLLALRPRRR